jgi:hypothetical protein
MSQSQQRLKKSVKALEIETVELRLLLQESSETTSEDYDYEW